MGAVALNRSINMLDDVIKNSNGKFLSVTFIKKDGTERTLTGRLGVKKHLRGGVSTLNPETYITLYDMTAKGYRAVNRATIQSVTIGGVTHDNV